MDRIATLETEPRTPEHLTAQLGDKGDRFPTVVAEREGRVVAWASAGPYRSRPSYSGVAEHGVVRAARGTGAGRAALEALCRAYAERGFGKIVSRIFPENTASLILHERCGFLVVGVYHRRTADPSGVVLPPGEPARVQRGAIDQGRRGVFRVAD